MSDLPEGWGTAPLDEIAEVILGQSPPSSTYNTDGEGLPFFQGKTEFGELYPTARKYCSVPGKIAEHDDVLISVRAPVGPTNLAPEKSCIGRGLAAIRPLGDAPSRYLLYYLRSIEHELEGKGTGTTFKAITGKILKGVEVPIAPLPEQRRIVARIEELFSRLDAGVAALRHAKAQLQRYRQSVLAAAVTGQLTQAWREQHPDTEPADQLLERILELRPSEWSGRGKYKTPTPPDTEGLPDLPKTWTWTNFETLAMAEKHALKAGPFGSALKKEFYVPSGYKIYGQEQVIKDDPYFGDYYIDEERFESLKSCETKPGDFLISLVGTIGRTMIVPEDAEPGIINPRLVKMSLDRRLIDARLLKVYLGSSRVKAFFKIVSHGGTMDVLNLTTLKALPIPLPPLDELPRILDEVEARTTAIDHLEAELDRQITRSNRLRQSTLASAFTGNLL